jgi:hypothetical protein
LFSFFPMFSLPFTHTPQPLSFSFSFAPLGISVLSLRISVSKCFFSPFKCHLEDIWFPQLCHIAVLFGFMVLWGEHLSVIICFTFFCFLQIIVSYRINLSFKK